jgi:hypothetical protein
MMFSATFNYHHRCYEFESLSGWGVQHYVLKFVSDLRQVSGFHRVLRFPPPIKLTAHDIPEILLKVAYAIMTTPIKVWLHGPVDNIVNKHFVQKHQKIAHKTKPSQIFIIYFTDPWYKTKYLIIYTYNGWFKRWVYHSSFQFLPINISKKWLHSNWSC